MNGLVGKAITMARMPERRRARVIEAIALLAVARIWLLAVPFRRVAAQLGTPLGAARERDPDIAPAQVLLAREIRLAIELAAARVPFRAVCLQQAVAAKLMLKRRGIPATVTFGVARNDDPGEPLRAHAWVDAGRVKVTGYPLEEALVPVARFV